MNKQIKIGDLVSSYLHVGIGIVLDIIHPEEVNNPASLVKLDESTAEVYWIFPDSIDEKTALWENGKDYEYLAQLVEIIEENKSSMITGT